MPKETKSRASKIHVCPLHKGKLKKCPQWSPPEGLDPKMFRLACRQCVEYWYKAPRHCLMRKEDVQLEFGIEVK